MTVGSCPEGMVVASVKATYLGCTEWPQESSNRLYLASFQGMAV